MDLYNGITIANRYGEILITTKKPIMIRYHTPQYKEKNEERCEWSFTAPECAWETTCHRMFSFIDGGPKENRYQYCPGCGQVIQQKSL